MDGKKKVDENKMMSLKYKKDRNSELSFDKTLPSEAST